MNSTENTNYDEYVYDDRANNAPLNNNLATSSVPEAKYSTYSPNFEVSFKKYKNKEVQDIYDDENYCLARSSSSHRKDEEHIEKEQPFKWKKILIICLVVIFIFLFAMFGGYVGSLINRNIVLNIQKLFYLQIS